MFKGLEAVEHELENTPVSSLRISKLSAALESNEEDKEGGDEIGDFTSFSEVADAGILEIHARNIVLGSSR